MTKRIPLTQGKFALVDDEDYESLSKQRWYAHWNYERLYARRTDKDGRKLLMHRVIMGSPKGKHVIHLNDDGLNNTRANLMIGSAKENLRSGTISYLNTSGTRGVCFNKAMEKYMAYISCDEGRIHLGHFDTLEEAVAVRKAAEIKYWKGRSSFYPPSNCSAF